MKVRIDGGGRRSFLARLAPPPVEIWELRITEPNTQVRFFGRFAAPDTLVLFSSRSRDVLGDRTKASGGRSQAWASAMYECEREWKGMFPDHAPFVGTKVQDYVSGNVEDCGKSVWPR